MNQIKSDRKVDTKLHAGFLTVINNLHEMNEDDIMQYWKWAIPQRKLQYLAMSVHLAALKETGITAKGKKDAIVALATEQKIPVSKMKDKVIEGWEGKPKACFKFCGNVASLIPARSSTTHEKDGKMCLELSTSPTCLSSSWEIVKTLRRKRLFCNQWDGRWG